MRALDTRGPCSGCWGFCPNTELHCQEGPASPAVGRAGILLCSGFSPGEPALQGRDAAAPECSRSAPWGEWRAGERRLCTFSLPRPSLAEVTCVKVADSAAAGPCQRKVFMVSVASRQPGAELPGLAGSLGDAGSAEGLRGLGRKPAPPARVLGAARASLPSWPLSKCSSRPSGPL